MPSSDIFVLTLAAAFFGAMWIYVAFCARV